jgi:undecaprenyl-diphosphatase
MARMFLMIIFATLPLFLILPINDMVESLYYQNVFIGVALILTGCMLYVSDKMKPGNKTERSMTILDALIIGLCQCVATIPGLSRSGTTITAGIATGLRRDFAVKFSFLLSIPAVLGANILSLVDAVQEGIVWSEVPAYLIGMLVAMVAGIISINLIKYISNKGKFGGFAYYCWVMGVLAIIMSMIF